MTTKTLFGSLGEVNVQGDMVECHLCGKWYLSLQAHAFLAHGLLAGDYRLRFGLNEAQALIGPGTSQKHRWNLLRRVARNEMREPWAPGKRVPGGRPNRGPQQLQGRLNARRSQRVGTYACTNCGTAIPKIMGSTHNRKTCGLECAKARSSHRGQHRNRKTP